MSSSVPMKELDVSAMLQTAIEHGAFECESHADVPLAILYDMDQWIGNLRYIQDAFGPNFLHCIALKAQSIGSLMEKARDLGLGAECASIGEVAVSLSSGFRPENIIFDSPAKTKEELTFTINKGIHVNIDNEIELEIVKSLVDSGVVKPRGTIGLRVNPLVGAGVIAALSVSTGDSKFGVPRTKNEIWDRIQEYDFINCIHVHVGSGGMGVQQLVAGVKVAVELAVEINKKFGTKKIHTLDMGGGMPVNYLSDSWTSEKVPSFQVYVDALRASCPDLFTFQVKTEFGQSANSKAGVVASRIQFVKQNASGPVSLIHFGADLCMRQVYTNEHNRRLKFFRSDGSSFPDNCEKVPSQSVAGPLCFQGDFLKKGLVDYPKVVAGDFIVQMDGGANTLSLLSRHCSRLSPAVYGIRANGKCELLKPRETMEDLLRFWGCQPTYEGIEETHKITNRAGARSRADDKSGKRSRSTSPNKSPKSKSARGKSPKK